MCRGRCAGGAACSASAPATRRRLSPLSPGTRSSSSRVSRPRPGGYASMAIKKYKPTSPGRRGMTVSSFEEVTTNEPYKRLTEVLKRHSGRNVHGHITTRHRGGGTRRLYRIIDFKRNKFGVPGKVATIEYDPNRSARIALINYVDGEKRYILAPNGLRVGMSIQAGSGSPIRVGN